MFTLPTQQRIDAYWAGFFGCQIEDLHASNTLVVPHAALADYAGAYLMRTTEACIISVPGYLMSQTVDQLGILPPTDAFDAAVVSRRFGSTVERVIGPAYQGYVDGGAFRPVGRRETRVLDERDTLALHHLAEACGEEEWGHCGIGNDDRQVVFGCFDGDELAAAGMGEPRNGALWHIGIVTHPSYRGRGYGRAVVSAIAAYGLDLGLIPWYQTLQANISSITVARSLGFSQYATTLAVRFRQADGE